MYWRSYAHENACKGRGFMCTRKVTRMSLSWLQQLLSSIFSLAKVCLHFWLHKFLTIISPLICRYATALERNPEDYDALYNWALVLQVWMMQFMSLLQEWVLVSFLTFYFLFGERNNRLSCLTLSNVTYHEILGWSSTICVIMIVLNMALWTLKLPL